MKVRKPSQKTKILTSLSIKKEGLIELEPLMQYVPHLVPSGQSCVPGKTFVIAI